MHETKNLHVTEIRPLQSPNELLAALPLPDRGSDFVHGARSEIERVIRGEDRRRLVIVGPCSIHDPEAAIAYAQRLQTLRDDLKDRLLIVMRVYFEKPRTTVGWKGLINDPHMDGSLDIPTGLRIARQLLLQLADMGMPTATEMLDPIVPQYIGDLIAWSAIGARTTESQTHREMASGLSMPVGFKNGTDGGLAVAINAMISASRPHSFLGIDGDGRVAVVRTGGNPNVHVVLRGGSKGPNYTRESVEEAVAALQKAGVNRGVLVDCSHDNSGKNHENQPTVVAEVGKQLRAGSTHVLGVMIESHLVAGRQDIKPGVPLRYGQSVTDACVDFDTTASMLTALAADVAA